MALWYGIVALHLSCIVTVSLNGRLKCIGWVKFLIDLKQSGRRALHRASQSL